MEKAGVGIQSFKNCVNGQSKWGVHNCFLNPEIQNHHHYSVLHDFVFFL